LKEERDKANKVKQEAPILVILGNPPYNAFAGTSPEEEGGLVDCYKEGLTKPVKEGGWGIKKFNLDDLYVRFFRVAERRIVKSGKGIVSYISNFSYLGDPSFVVMRTKFLAEFDRIWIDCMNGDSRETGKSTPEGKPDPSVFTTKQTSVGIQVGTSICVLVRKEKRDEKPRVRFQHYWGKGKREDLLESLGEKNFESRYENAKPVKVNRYSFRPIEIGAHYMEWALVPSLGLEHYNGPVERRAFALISIDREPLEHRMEMYFDASVSNDKIAEVYPSLMMTGNRIVGPEARKKILKESSFKQDCIVTYPFKPFDLRWCYLDNIRPLFSEPSPRLLSQRLAIGNAFFITRDTADKNPEGIPFLYSSSVCDYDSISGHARHFPILLWQESKKSKADAAVEAMYGEKAGEQIITANLSETARGYLAELGIGNPDKDAQTAGLIWMHALAIGYSSAYFDENADGIRQDWPRIPLPRTKKVLLESAELGRRVASLLDTENPVEGVKKGKIDERLKSIGVITRVEGGSIRPEKGELELTVGWGHAGKGGVCMPGKGKYVVRRQEDKELRKMFGDETLDIYLNDASYWENVPKCVWEYYIGGYQVIKKWLSYREKGMLGRGLKVEEAEYVTEMARRLSALVLLQEELNANYNAVKEETWLWPVQQ